MKKFSIFSLLVLVATLVITPAVSWGADPVTYMVPESDILASVTLSNAKIITQEGNKIKLSFDLVSEKKSQPQVKYSVSLTKQVKGGSMPVDEKVYSEVLSLAENQVLPKEIEYTAPAYLKGEYDLWVKAMNENSLILGLGVAGKITLNGTGEFVEIISSSCYLTITGETNKKYNLTQGVDITTSEKLVGHCEVKNNFKTKVTVTPFFETFWRTIYGKLVSSNAIDGLTLNAGEKKVINYEIPTVQQPQAYDAVLSFKDSSGKVVSNSIRFHYVIQGISATIQNVRFDKDYYLKDQTANLTLSWTPSADSFYGSRSGADPKDMAVIVEANIKNSQGNNCANVFSKQISVSEANSVLNVPITADCVNPSAEVVIKDTQGNILDKNTFDIETKSEVVKPTVPAVPTTTTGNTTIIVYVGVVLLVLILIIFFLWKKGKSAVVPPIMLMLSLAAAGMFLFTNNASAHTFTVSGCGDGPGHCRANYYTTSISGTVFQPGQAIGAYLYGVATACSNGGSEIWAGATGSWEGTTDITHWLIRQYGGSGGFTASGSTTFTAPSTPGNYYIRFCGNGGSWGCVDEPFTVSGCGNSLLDTGEQCDLGSANNGACPRTCSSSCTINTCAPPCILTPLSAPIGSITTTPPSTPAQTFKGSTFQVKCDYGSIGIDGIDVVTNAVNNAAGEKDCTWTGWDDTAATFRCNADVIGTHNVSCLVNNIYPGANYCARPATVIGTIKVLDPEDCSPACTAPRNQCCRTPGQPGVCRVNCSSCTTDASCGVGECCNKETSVCSTNSSYCGALDFSLNANDISIYLTDNDVLHSGSTRVRVTPGGGFTRSVNFSTASISPTGSLTSSMITYNPDPLTQTGYTQGANLTVRVPYDIIPVGTSRTYQLTINGRAGTIEKAKNIMVRIYGQGWAQP